MPSLQDGRIKQSVMSSGKEKNVSNSQTSQPKKDAEKNLQDST